MLAAVTDSPRLSPGWAAEPKWDGFRGWLIRDLIGGARLVSRRGVDLSAAFPELIDAAAALPAAIGDVAFDGEVVIWKEGRTDFGLLLKRLGRRPAAAKLLARQDPAHFVAFDLLHLAGRDLTGEPYRTRRAELESVFTRHGLAGSWTLTPSTTDPDDVELWLTALPPLGIEGVVFKDRERRYQSGRQRSWLKYKPRTSTEAIVAAISGSVERPSSLLLGRYDRFGRLRFVGRTTSLPRATAAVLGAALAPGPDDHPWAGLRFRATWGASADLRATLVVPSLVVEVDADVARDPTGRLRHPVPFRRVRPDLRSTDVPLFDELDDRASGQD